MNDVRLSFLIAGAKRERRQGLAGAVLCIPSADLTLQAHAPLSKATKETALFPQVESPALLLRSEDHCFLRLSQNTKQTKHSGAPQYVFIMLLPKGDQ